MSAEALGEALELARAARELQADLAARGIAVTTAEAVQRVREDQNGGRPDGPLALGRAARTLQAELAGLGIEVTTAEAVRRVHARSSR